MIIPEEFSAISAGAVEGLNREPYILTTATVRLTVKGKTETRENNRFLVSPLHLFFAFWGPKEAVFADAQVIPLSLFQTFDFDERQKTYKSTLSDGTQLTLVFSEPSFIETFNQVLSLALANQSAKVEEPKEYFRYLLGALDECKSLERSTVVETDVLRNNAGNLKPVLGMAPLKPFRFVLDESKDTLFRKRIWLGLVKVTKHGLDKSVVEVTDGMAKSGKSGVLVFVTARQLLQLEYEPTDHYPQIYNNVIDPLSVPGWLDINTAYIFDAPGSSKTPPPSFFPFKQALAMQ